MENKYFYLNQHCFLVNGKKGSAIYDLLNNQLFSIDLEIGKILENLEYSNNVIFNILAKYSKKKKREIIDYLKEIEKLHLGYFYGKNIVAEKIRPIMSKEKIISLEYPLPLNKIWLEIENRCNLNCSYCYADITERCSCNLLSKHVNKKNFLSLNDYYKLLNDATLFNCSKLTIAGGEPLLSRNKMFSIIKYALNLDIPEIVLYSNGLLFDEEILSFLKRNKITWLCNFYCSKKEINDKITQSIGCWKKQVDKFKLALNYNVNLIINIPIIRENQEYVDETVFFLKDIGVDDINYNFITTQDYNYRTDKYSEYIFMKKSRLQNPSKETFFMNREYHPCWNGSLAITVNGKVLPCHMAHSEVIGDIKEANIRLLIGKNETKKWWEMSKDYIENCKTCEFRYACFDCPLKIDKNSKKRYCTIY